MTVDKCARTGNYRWTLRQCFGSGQKNRRPFSGASSSLLRPHPATATCRRPTRCTFESTACRKKEISNFKKILTLPVNIKDLPLQNRIVLCRERLVGNGLLLFRLAFLTVSFARAPLPQNFVFQLSELVEHEPHAFQRDTLFQHKETSVDERSKTKSEETRNTTRTLSSRAMSVR